LDQVLVTSGFTI